MRSGLFIVTLKNKEPMRIDRDSRRANTAISVTKENCKWGKTTDFKRRQKEFEKTFDKDNVKFEPVFRLKDIHAAKNVIKDALDEYCILGKTGRKHEWLQGIKPERVIELMRYQLDKAGIEYEPLL